jgi:hypothetical protein
MHEKDSAEAEGRALVSNKTMEIVVALLLLGGCAIVIYDSTGLRLAWLQSGAGSWVPEFKIDWLRFTWQEGFGPGPSYFPFWVAVILGFSSLVTLVTTVLRPGEVETFVSVRSFGRVLAVLVPSFVYAMLIGGVSVGPVTVPGIGIYVSSAIFICFFMLAIGRQGVLKSILVSIGVPLMLFFMFEKWFLVPLPKGPLEAFLGY